MKKRMPVLIVVAALLFLAAARAEAVWKFSRVDSFRGPLLRFEQGEFVYRKNDDVFHYRMSTDQRTAVTANGPLAVETPLQVHDGWVWYVSVFPVPSPVYRLYRYHVDTGRNELLYSSADEIDLYGSSWDAGCLVVMIGGDWWFWDGEAMEQITFSGPALSKEDPFLHGNHLVWVGEGRVYYTYLPTRETCRITDAEIQDHSLRACRSHAAWVEPAGTGSGYRVQLLRFGTLETAGVDTSAEASMCQVSLDPNYLIYTKKSGDLWSIMRLYLYDRNPVALYTSGLPLDNPGGVGGDLFFVAMNCPDMQCMELYKYDLTAGVTTQLTHYGQGSFICTYEAQGDTIALVRLFMFQPDEPLELFAGRDEPGPVCGTALAGTGPGGIRLNLVLLVLAPTGILFRRLRAR